MRTILVDAETGEETSIIIDTVFKDLVKDMIDWLDEQGIKVVAKEIPERKI